MEDTSNDTFDKNEETEEEREDIGCGDDVVKVSGYLLGKSWDAPDEEEVGSEGDKVVLSSIGGVERDVAPGCGGAPEGVAGDDQGEVGPR